MPVYASLLRGINVGGNKKLPMADLRALYADLGLRHTKTLLQSGNAVFESDLTDPAELTTLIEAGIEKRFGFHSDIFIRTANQLQAAIDTCPCPHEELEQPSKLLIPFLNKAPAPENITAFIAGFDGPEHLYIRGDLIYIFFPDGMGQSKFNQAKMDRALGTSATGRNWNTLNNLATLAVSLTA